VKKLALASLVAAVVAGSLAEAAASAVFFVFHPLTAQPGERVEVRTPWTSARYRPQRPFQRFHLYLVRNHLADRVRSPRDPRLVPIGSARLDARFRGRLRFVVPSVDPGVYTAAFWCPRCPGTRFQSFTVGSQVVPRYRQRMTLRVYVPVPRATDEAGVVSGLRRQRLPMEFAGEGNLPIMGAPSRSYRNGGDVVTVWQLASAAAATAVSFSPDGSTLSWAEPGGIGRILHIDFAGQPHWFRRGRVIVLYVGRDPFLLGALRLVLGGQVHH
jgi:hypothetical protein